MVGTTVIHHLLIRLFFLVLPLWGFAQGRELYREGFFVQESDSLPYRILLPEKIDAQKSYPLLVFLHGSGERGSDNALQLTHGAALFAADSTRSKYPAFVLFPQCPLGKSWHTIQYGRADGKWFFKVPPGIWENKQQELLKGLVDELLRRYPIDSKRLYAGGLSMGGIGTFELVRRQPERFAAAFVICGAAPAQWSDDLKAEHWWLFHGARDSIIPSRYSQPIFKALKQDGKEVRYTVYPEVGHDSWTDAFAEPALLQWLFSKRLD